MLTFEQVVLEQGDFRLTADFSVTRGSRTAVMGPSGAGKSTLLAAIGGFFAPAQGRILWQGADLAALSPGKRPVAMIFQDNNLFPHLTAFENAALGLRPSGRLNTKETARVQDALAQVGLAGFATRKPATLSGGQQSRAALARMLVQDRPLVLLDEPFAALGPALRAEMIALVKSLLVSTRATLLMVTHDPADARALGGDLVVVADGVAHPPALAGALLDAPPAALREYLG